VLAAGRSLLIAAVPAFSPEGYEKMDSLHRQALLRRPEFFLLDMGLVAARGWGDLRRAGGFLMSLRC